MSTPAAEPGARQAARRANEQRFADPGYLPGYQTTDALHGVRIELAIQALERGLRTDSGRAADGALVLDVGTGNGVTASRLAQRGFRVVASDIMPSGVQHLPGALHGRVLLDAEAALPFGDGTLDGILAGDVVQNLYDPLRFLVECRRVLRPAGVLALTTPNLAPLQDRVRFLAGRSPRHVDPTHGYLRLHIRPFTYPTLARLLREAGFEPFSLASNHLVLRRGERRICLRWPARLWPTAGNVLIVGASARPTGRGTGTGSIEGG